MSEKEPVEALSFEALERAAEIEDMDPLILTKLTQAHAVLLSHMDAVSLEAQAALQAVYDNHAAYTAMLQSHVYALTAQAHKMGFTISQVNRVLGTVGPDDDAD